MSNAPEPAIRWLSCAACLRAATGLIDSIAGSEEAKVWFSDALLSFKLTISGLLLEKNDRLPVSSLAAASSVLVFLVEFSA